MPVATKTQLPENFSDIYLSKAIFLILFIGMLLIKTLYSVFGVLITPFIHMAHSTALMVILISFLSLSQGTLVRRLKNLVTCHFAWSHKNVFTY